MEIQFYILVVSIIVLEINGTCKKEYSCVKTKQEVYTTECGLWGWSRCTKYRQVAFTDICYQDYEAVDGKWTSWGSWTSGSCSATCGQGIIERTRERDCVFHDDITKTGNCLGTATEKYVQSCLDLNCEVINGGWSEWKAVGGWSKCSVSCGGGTQSMVYVRSCDNPHPSPGGEECYGESNTTLQRPCNENICPDKQCRTYDDVEMCATCQADESSQSSCDDERLKLALRTAENGTCDEQDDSTTGEGSNGSSNNDENGTDGGDATGSSSNGGNDTTGGGSTGSSNGGEDGDNGGDGSANSGDSTGSSNDSEDGTNGGDSTGSSNDGEDGTNGGDSTGSSNGGEGGSGSGVSTGSPNDGEDGTNGSIDTISERNWTDDLCLADTMSQACQPCIDGQTFPRADCTKYQVCSGSTLEDRSCDVSQRWNQDTQTCENLENLSCHICPDGERYPYPESCKMYYECRLGQPEPMTCDDDKSFDIESKSCVSTNTILQQPCNKCVHNSRYLNPSRCEKFYICSYERLYVITCPTGLAFNPETRNCDTGSSQCCLEGQFYEHSDCRKYFMCDNGKRIENNCPSGTKWNNEEQDCTHECTPCVNGWSYMHNDCSKYYDCSGGTGQLNTCGEGYIWNQRVSKCVVQLPQYNGTCTACEEEELYDHESCELFYICANGEPILSHCPPGTVFNLNYKDCRLNSHKEECNYV